MPSSTRSTFCSRISAARARAVASPSSDVCPLSSTAESAPMASALRSCSPLVDSPTLIATTSPEPCASLRRSAVSSANSSYGLMMNLIPAGSIDFPPAAIRMRASVSGTRLMQTAIFTDTPSVPGRARMYGRPGSVSSGRDRRSVDGYGRSPDDGMARVDNEQEAVFGSVQAGRREERCLAGETAIAAPLATARPGERADDACALIDHAHDVVVAI